MSEESVWLSRSQALRKAKTNEFMKLHKISGLDRTKDYRFGDWSGINFSGCDLRRFDFTGARLRDCKFKGAYITGARFDQAEVNGTNLRGAEDWLQYRKNWRMPPYGVGITPIGELRAGARVRLCATKHLPNFSIFQDAPFAPELVVIPSGYFIMGAKVGEGHEDGREYPQHEVTIDYRLAVGRFAVTFEEWDFYCLHNSEARKPGDEGWGRNKRPVINVSWEDAQKYLKWLSYSTGYHYRLLSESEWEYCSRAGIEIAYWLQGNFSNQLGNYNKKGTVHVNMYGPNSFGLYQMCGNTWEWCEDHWHNAYFSAPDNGSAWVENDYGQSANRVIRGGSWTYKPISWRDREAPFDSGYDLGFRVARTLR